MITLLCGCDLNINSKKNEGDVYNGVDYTDEESLTIEEIRTYVQNKYFDKYGKAISWFWENGKGYDRIVPFEMPEIESYDINFIKDLNGGLDWFLVEFEPIGCLIGSRRTAIPSIRYNKQSDVSKGPAMSFYGYESPYKILSIPSEDRYASHGIQAWAKIDDIKYEYDGVERDGPAIINIWDARYGIVLNYPDGFLHQNGTTEKIYFNENNIIKDCYVKRPIYGKYDRFNYNYWKE